MIKKRYKVLNTTTKKELIVLEDVLSFFTKQPNIELIEEMKSIDVRNHMIGTRNTKNLTTLDEKSTKEVSKLLEIKTKEVKPKTVTKKATSKKTVTKKTTKKVTKK